MMVSETLNKAKDERHEFKANSQMGARSKDKRKGSGRRSDTNPTSDRLFELGNGLLLLGGNNGEIDEPSFSTRDNGLADVDRVLLLVGSNRTVGEQGF